MATLTLEEKQHIIKTNPQKQLIADAREMASNLMMLIHGHGLKLNQDPYFENPDVFASRNKKPVSNKDVFGRLFQREQMVFSAQGGSSFYIGLSKEEATTLNATLDKIRFGTSLRNWIQSFALPAWRCDPMGVLFIESDNKGAVYPTYKSIASVYDYLPNGRSLEYICFKLTKADCDTFGVSDSTIKDQPKTYSTNYFRIVDDVSDEIYKFDNNVVAIATMSVGYKPTVNHKWEKTPGFIVSNIISFENVQKFLSPVNLCTELAECYLNDRSIRDLQKKYHGFLKAVEPLLNCGICEGTGFLSGAACPECTPAGSDKGTGYKLRTKVSDIARFPIKTGTGENFNFKNYFGYVDLDIKVWQQQDTSLNDIEGLIRYVYWGADDHPTQTGPQVGDKSIRETATKTLANLQPIYARLNTTADWAECTENMIADFIGKYMFSSFKSASITYGRYYILETPYELMEEYLDMKTKGASQSSLFSALRRYTHSMYATNPEQLAVELKMINVEPFVHNTAAEVMLLTPAKIDYISKLYFGEWRQLQSFDYLLGTQEQALRDSLTQYAKDKLALIPEPEPIVPTGAGT